MLFRSAFDPVLIRVSDIKRIISLAKGDKRKFAAPVSLNIAGDIVSASVLGDSLTVRTWTANFPPYEHLFPTGQTVAIPGIGFNPAFFADYAKIAGKGNPVRVQFYGELKPIEILLGESWRAMLMPMRIR